MACRACSMRSTVSRTFLMPWSVNRASEMAKEAKDRVQDAATNLVTGATTDNRTTDNR